MSDDYFTRLDRQLAQLTTAGAHLNPPRKWRMDRWRALGHAALRTVAVVSLAIVLAATLLVIDFPAPASGDVHTSRGLTNAAAQPGRTAVRIAARGVAGADA